MSANRSHSAAASMRLLSLFMADLEELRAVMTDVPAHAGWPRGDSDRAVVERLASALWGVFSHSRAVIDQNGRHYDLGSWRAAGELIADVANAHYPDIRSPVRYMDCYMGVLLGEEHSESARPLHRWIFSRLHAAECIWVYSFSQEPNGRTHLRELAEALTQAYEDNAPFGLHAPMPAVIAAYQDVYGNLPEGWRV